MMLVHQNFQKVNKKKDGRYRARNCSKTKQQNIIYARNRRLYMFNGLLGKQNIHRRIKQV
jgi:hypothetical protein